jgi:uncharacterized protein (DUF2252 family)
MHALDVWHYHVGADRVVALFEEASSKSGHKGAAKMVRKARSRTHQQTIEDLTYVEDGRRQIVSDSPLLVPAREMAQDVEMNTGELRQLTEEAIGSAWAQYLDSLPDERLYLLRRLRIMDAVLRVGGVGSVGARCEIVLLEGEASDDTLLLQLKEAGPSALEPYLPKRAHHVHAEHVVTGQRLMQAASDMFLGWHSSALADRDYYWRQLKDMKGSPDVAALDQAGFETYVSLCSMCLARAHARTGDERAICGYVGRNDSLPEAIGDFALSYADQTERDHQALEKAVRSGRLAAEREI